MKSLELLSLSQSFVLSILRDPLSSSMPCHSLSFPEIIVLEQHQLNELYVVMNYQNHLGIVVLSNVQSHFSASFQYIKLRNFFPKASAKIGITTFIKSYSINDCKSMVCVQYDITAVLIYVKGKIVHYRFCCIARDALQKMVGLLKKIW